MTARPTRTKAAPQPAESGAKLPWSPRVRGIVSILLAAHILAVFVAPWSMPPPSTDLARGIARRISPYLHAVFIYHGYRFFAPNPGNSHIVEYELVFDDGTTKTGRFPDLSQHWPRLLYHRHFMISERVWELSRASGEAPRKPDFPPGVPAIEHARAMEGYERAKITYDEARVRRDLLLDGLAKNLLADSGAKSVRLWAVEHVIPAPEAVLEGVRLTDQDSYIRIPLGEFPPAVETIQPPGPWRMP